MSFRSTAPSVLILSRCRQNLNGSPAFKPREFCLITISSILHGASLSLVPTSEITIIIISTNTNTTLLCRLHVCLSGNVQKHNHKRPYDQHNHNHKKMIDHFLMIIIMSMTMTMLLFFIVGTRNHNDIIRTIMMQLGHCVLANNIPGPVLSGRFILTETRIGIPFFEF